MQSTLKDSLSTQVTQKNGSAPVFIIIGNWDCKYIVCLLLLCCFIGNADFNFNIENMLHMWYSIYVLEINKCE